VRRRKHSKSSRKFFSLFCSFSACPCACDVRSFIYFQLLALRRRSFATAAPSIVVVRLPIAVPSFRSPFAVRRSPFAVRRSPFEVRSSKFVRSFFVAGSTNQRTNEPTQRNEMKPTNCQPQTNVRSFVRLNFERTSKERTNFKRTNERTNERTTNERSRCHAALPHSLNN